MISQQTLKGSWNEIAGKLRSKWGQLSEDELERHQGNVQELVGYIQRKTGVARDQIERFLNDLGAEGSGAREGPPGPCRMRHRGPRKPLARVRSRSPDMPRPATPPPSRSCKTALRLRWRRRSGPG